MSSTRSRRSRRTRNQPDAGSDDPSDHPEQPSVSGSDLYSDAGLETRSGLRTSEVEMSSPLSYGEAASSLADWERSPAAQAAAASSVRPGVREEGSRAAPLFSMATSSSTGHADRADDTSSVIGAQSGSHTVIWGTDVNVGRVMDRFKRFLSNFKTNELSEEPRLTTGRDIDPNQPLYLQKLDDMAASGSTSLEVNCIHLNAFYPELYQQLVAYPKEVIPACDSAAHQLFMEKHREILLERPVQIRPYNCVGRTRALRLLNPEDLEQLLSISGMVIRLSTVIPEMMRAHFECSVCSSVKHVVCERGRVEEPRTCENCNAAYAFRLIHNRCLFADKQMIKLQESPEDMPAGQTPHTIVAYSHEDLVDSVQPGDRVTVTGIFRANPIKSNPRQRTLKAVYRTFVDVIHFKKTSAHRLREAGEGGNLGDERVKEIMELAAKPDLYERLSSAIAPSIYENEDIKKGILLQLFGGKDKDFSSAGRGTFRSEVNILLCGDPGTSKSQLLQYVYNLLPRTQYTSGKGSSAVGLTAYITKDPETRQLALQTGALVLADRGVCCIDEFDKMPDGTRSVLHEVMEQQTLSIAKAGIICQLNARTSVLAAANPIGSKWDNKRTIIDNIQLPHTLLSRFDLIFLILDPQDEVFDARLARHLVSLYYKTPESYQEEFVSMDMLRDYIAYAKEIIQPRLSEEAQQYLVEEYVEMRKLGSGRGQISAYPRQLESLIRLAEAHARMRLSNRVTADDCREARRLQREALKQAATDPSTGMIDVNILATGVSSTLRKRREEVATAIWSLLTEKGRVLTFTYQRVFEELKGSSERAISRELFEDGLNVLKNENKIDWAGNTIRKR